MFGTWGKILQFSKDLGYAIASGVGHVSLSEWRFWINTRSRRWMVGVKVIVGQIDPTGQVWYVDLTIVLL